MATSGENGLPQNVIWFIINNVAVDCPSTEIFSNLALNFREVRTYSDGSGLGIPHRCTFETELVRLTEEELQAIRNNEHIQRVLAPRHQNEYNDHYS